MTCYRSNISKWICCLTSSKPFSDIVISNSKLFSCCFQFLLIIQHCFFVYSTDAIGGCQARATRDFIKIHDRSALSFKAGDIINVSYTVNERNVKVARFVFCGMLLLRRILKNPSLVEDLEEFFSGCRGFWWNKTNKTKNTHPYL